MDSSETTDHLLDGSNQANHAETIPLSEVSVSSNRPSRISNYSIVGEIARGGMGIVYRATDTRLKRDVAIKVIRSGCSSSEESRRFLIEAQSSAKLDHPNIVPVFESGEHDGQPFIALAFVNGSSLWSKIADQPMKDRQAAALFVEICDAIAYAHSMGVIHRDLKPQNILISADGKPKVTDFGLAKSTRGDSSLTREGTVMGTPSYMPPEQALGKTEQVNELSDVYSLGATLYATLTTRPPFQAVSPIETIRQVVDAEPMPPGLLNVNLAKDLETICLKALRKEPSKRYSSATEMKEDLIRFLDGVPIQARRVTAIEKTWRWCKRNSLSASAIATAVTLLVGTAVVSTVFYLRERELTHQKDQLLEDRKKFADAESAQRKKAEILAEEATLAESLAHHRLQRARILAGDGFSKLHESGKALAWHLHAWKNSKETTDDKIHRLRVFNDQMSNRVQLEGLAVFDSPVVRIDLSNRRDKVLIVIEKKKAFIRSCAELHAQGPVLEVSDTIIKTAWDPQDRRVATLSQSGIVQLWDGESGELLHTKRLSRRNSSGLQFHPISADLYVCNDNGGLSRLDQKDPNIVESIPISTLSVADFAWSPDGKQLATIDTHQRSELWDWNSKVRLWPKENVTFAEGFEDVLSRFTPKFNLDGKYLLVRDATSVDCKTGVVIKTDDQSVAFSFPLQRVWAAYSYWQFDEQSEQVCINLGNQTGLFDVSSGTKKFQIRHPRESNSGSLSPNGKRFVATTTSGQMHAYDTETGDSEFDAPRHAHTCDDLIFCNDDEFLTGCRDGTVRLWKIRDQTYTPVRRKVADGPLSYSDARFSLDGTRKIELTDVDWERGFLVRDLVANKNLLGPIERPHPNRSTWGRSFQQEVIGAARLSPSGKLAAISISSSGTIAVWDVDRQRCIFAKPQLFLGALRTLSFSDDESLLITSCSDNTARVWRVADGTPVSPLIPVGFVSFVSLSKDNRILSHIDLAVEPYRLQLFDAKTGDQIVELPGVMNNDRSGFESEKGNWSANPVENGIQLFLTRQSSEEAKTARIQRRLVYEYELANYDCDISLVSDIAKLSSGFHIDDNESLAYLNPFEFIDNASRYRESWLQWKLIHGSQPGKTTNLNQSEH